MEFNTEEAWSMIKAEGANLFKTSDSTWEEIVDPVLRMAHLFLAHNLLGHSNTTITTTELYFMWCMLKKVKVHLGYWLAHSCYKIARHPVHHLYACHLLGVYLIRNVMPRMKIPKSSVVICEDQEWFDIAYFINLSIIERKGEALVFCEAGQSQEEGEERSSEKDSDPVLAQEGKTASEERSNPVEVEPGQSEKRPRPPMARPETSEARPQSTEKGREDTEEKWQRIIEFMMNKFSEANKKKQEFLELQNKNMTKALSLIERMTDLAEQNNQMALQLMSTTST